VEIPHLAALLALGLAAAGCAADARAPAGRTAATVALGQPARLGTLVVTPLRIEEDSRCPSEVQCIQAGTVRVAVRLAERRARREAEVTLSEPLRLDGGRSLTLAAVRPYPRRPGPIRTAAYRLTFSLGAAP
jgi:hypothetical protein